MSKLNELMRRADDSDPESIKALVRELTRRGFICVDEVTRCALEAAREMYIELCEEMGASGFGLDCSFDDDMGEIDISPTIHIRVDGVQYSIHSASCTLGHMGTREEARAAIEHAKASAIQQNRRRVARRQMDEERNLAMFGTRRSPWEMSAARILRDMEEQTARHIEGRGADILIIDDLVTMSKGKPVGEPAAHAAFMDYLNAHVIRDTGDDNQERAEDDAPDTEETE